MRQSRPPAAVLGVGHYRMAVHDFDALELYPGDPILGLNALFRDDVRPEKVNLGVGVYLDADGRLPLLQAVATAEQHLAESPQPKGYLPIGGDPAFVDATVGFVFAGAEAVAQQRVAAVQTLGGSGALKVAGDFCKQTLGATTVALSSPSWGNHEAIFAGCGLDVIRYRYHDADGHRVDVDGMCADLAAMAPGTVVLLHACCHNPTGFDLTADEWARVVEVIERAELLPFVDMAYQGFGDGVEEDLLGVRALLASGQRFLLASSFSKNMSLYGERMGALSIVCTSQDEAQRVESQLCRLIRTIYSTPPTHGAQIVATVLTDPTLRAAWLAELDAMRTRIRTMRATLRAELEKRGATSMGFITDQRGMFSYTGFTPEEMLRLRTEHAIYGTADGRICVAGLNPGNVGHVAEAFAAILSHR